MHAILWPKHADTQHTLNPVRETTLRAVIRRSAKIITTMMTRIAQMGIMETTTATLVVRVPAAAQESEPLSVLPPKTKADIHLKTKENNNNRIKAITSRVMLIHHQWLPLFKCTNQISSKISRLSKNLYRLHHKPST